MVKNYLFYFCVLFSLLIISCNKEEEIGYVDYDPKISVEGWIENGTPATVMLTWTASFNQEMDTTYLLNHVIKSAKVSVSDGEQTEILTLGMNKNYLPPYTYYGSSLIGKTGKTYTLKIEYQNKTIAAQTYIPQAVPLDDYWFVPESDTSGYVHIGFKNDVMSGNYYQIATKVKNKETIFKPCLYGNIDPAIFNVGESVSIQINKGPVLYPDVNFETYFIKGDTVLLKFRTQPKPGYDFWNSWQNEVLNAQNPIFPANTSLKSNIEGGVGIWCGYGTYNYQVIAK